MIPFATYYAAKTSNVFQWAGQPPKIAPSGGDLDGSFGPSESAPNDISIGSAVFATHRQTNRPRYMRHL